MVLSMQPDILLTPRGLIPVVSNGGNEESDKKKNNKNRKWVILGNKSDRGSDLVLNSLILAF